MVAVAVEVLVVQMVLEPLVATLQQALLVAQVAEELIMVALVVILMPI